MAISRARKEELVQGYIEQLKTSNGIVITHYQGLSVGELETLRGEIRKAEGSYSVVKNSLAKIALKEAELPNLDDLLTGPVGIGFCQQNVTGVAKAITDYSKENDGLTIKGGLLGNEVIDEDAIKNLASLPSIEELRGQIVGMINTPATRLTGALASSVRQVVNVLNAYAEKDNDAGEAEAAAS